jgi:hypothetical protein
LLFRSAIAIGITNPIDARSGNDIQPSILPSGDAHGGHSTFIEESLLIQRAVSIAILKAIDSIHLGPRISIWWKVRMALHDKEPTLAIESTADRSD